MTKNFFHKTTFCSIALFFSGLLAAQSKTVVKASVDRSQILIGERIQLTLEADIPETQPIRFFQLDSIPHFEFISFGKIDTSNTGGGTILSQVIQITSFDSGHWVIPVLPLGEAAATDSIPVDVGFSPFDPQQPYHDVKDILEVNPPEEKKDNRLWWYVGGGVLLVLLLALLLRRPKKPVAKPAPPPVHPYKQALEQLEKLRKERLTPKAYYSGLTDVFRVYVEKRKGVHSLQQTTGDLVLQLRSIGMEEGIFKQLADTLQLSDMVKFAKYEPSSADDTKTFETIKKSIEHIEQSIQPPTNSLPG
ncbi:MAG: hypothetical protein ACTHMV_19465 [Chitinophagaceae bacterium]